MLPHSKSSSLIKDLALFAGVGAVAASALSLTALPVIGGMFLPFAIALGGAAGLVAGGIKHAISGRGSDGVDTARLGASLVPPSGMSPPPFPVGSSIGR